MVSVPTVVTQAGYQIGDTDLLPRTIDAVLRIRSWVASITKCLANTDTIGTFFWFDVIRDDGYRHRCSGIVMLCGRRGDVLLRLQH